MLGLVVSHRLVRWRPLCGLALVLVFAASAAGQARRERTHPILRPSSDAPTATVRGLEFSPAAEGGWTLYSAGDDKLVRRWSLSTGDGAALVPAGNFVWPIFRDLRGVIYALAVHRDAAGGEDRLAFGGVGQKTPQVNLLSASLPDEAEVLLHDEVLDRSAVYALDFNPAGTQLAVAHDGNPRVLLWDVAAPAGGEKRPARVLSTGLTTVRWLAFSPRGDRLALCGQKDNAWAVQIWNANATATGTAPEHTVPLSAIADGGLAWRDDDTWLVATRRGLVQGSLRGASETLFADRYITALVAAGDTVLLGVYDPDHRTGQVLRWTGSGEPQELAEASFADAVSALAIAPDGSHAAAGGLGLAGAQRLPVNRIRVWDLRADRVVAQAPSDAAAEAGGAPIANVGIIRGEINPVNKRRRPDWVAFAWGAFDRAAEPPPLAKKIRLLSREDVVDVEPGDVPFVGEPHDRKFLRSDIDGTYYLALADGSDPWGPLPNWGTNFPYKYAISDKLLALGFVNGITVCDLTAIRQVRSKPKDQRRPAAEAAILRHFYGHAGAVTSLAFAPDGDWLLSGSTDGTIAAWNLKEIAARRELGIALRVNARNNLEIVGDPPAGSPGWEAGLRRGQLIASVAVAGEEIAPAGWKQALEHPVPGKELMIGIGGIRGEPLLTTVSHDPFWTLHPHQDGNWCLWTPSGNFDASVEGMSRLEWHVNLGGDERSRAGAEVGAMLFAGSDFQELYQQPDVLDRVIRDRLPDPLRDVALPPRLELAIDARDPRIVRLSAKPLGTESIGEISLWLNGRRLATAAGAQALEAHVDPAQLRSGRNDVLGVAVVRTAAGQLQSSVLKPYPIRGTSSQPPRLHFVGVGVTEMPQRPDLRELEQSGRDVEALAAAAAQLQGFQPGFIQALVHGGDDEPTEANVRAQLGLLAQQARPDDLAIVVLAGHGIVTPRDGFRFILQDTPSGEVQGLSTEDINAMLAELSCRTLLLLDTCHSEGIGIRQQLRNWPGLGLGPLVLTACGSDETSKEHPELGVDEADRGHGLFTAAVLEALTGRTLLGRREPPSSDSDGDGQLSLDELCRYTQRRTADLVRELNLSAQNPKILRSVTFKDPERVLLRGM